MKVDYLHKRKNLDFDWRSLYSLLIKHKKQISQSGLEFFFFIWVLWPVKIISLILNGVSHKVGRQQEIPKKKHPQAELGLIHMWPELGLNPQQWDEERVRALKISILNHSATRTTMKFCGTCS